MFRYDVRALAFAGIGLALVGCAKKPHRPGEPANGAWTLRLELAAERAGEARIRFEKIEDGNALPVLDMRMPWKVTARMDDGSAQVRLGPPTFPGATTPAPWPAGSTALVQIDPLDHDSRWKMAVSNDAPFGAKVILEQALKTRYPSGVGIVALPAAPVRVGETWSTDEPPSGGVHTHRQSQLLSCDGKRARIAIVEDSTVDDSSAVEHVRGEIEYALDQPLPVGGWLRIEGRQADGHQHTLAYLYGR